MFEKEAEDNKPSYAFCSFNTKCELWKDGFQQGAKFGYNKAKVEVEDSYRESFCNSELNLASITERLEDKKRNGVQKITTEKIIENTSRNKEIIKNTSQNEVKKIIESKQLEFSF